MQPVSNVFQIWQNAIQRVAHIVRHKTENKIVFHKYRQNLSKILVGSQQKWKEYEYTENWVYRQLRFYTIILIRHPGMVQNYSYFNLPCLLSTLILKTQPSN